MQIDQIIKKKRSYEINCRLISFVGFYAAASYFFGAFKFGDNESMYMQPEPLMLVFGILLLAFSFGLLAKNKVISIFLAVSYFVFRFLLVEPPEYINRDLVLSVIAFLLLVYGAVSSFLYHKWHNLFLESYK